MKYIVNEKEKMVIAIMEETALDVINYIKATDKKVMFFGDIHKKLLLNDTYKGIAKCHPEDEFDEEKGKMIAKAKAVYKHDLAFHKAVEYYYMHEMAMLDKLKSRSSDKYLNSLKKKENFEAKM